MSDQAGPSGGPAHIAFSPTVRNRLREVKGAGGRRWTQRLADVITRFSGSMTFVFLHVVWFAVWILANLVLPHPFDPFPFGLLTLVVSLEAIFLSTFVLVSQNQQAADSDRRSEQDFQTNVYAEVLAELVGEKLGVAAADVQQRFEKRIAVADAEDAARS